MKKLILAILFLPSFSWAAGLEIFRNPKAILSSTNTWTAAQTFSSGTFKGDLTILGNCVGCGGGSGTSQNYPDWTVSGSQNLNSTNSNSITIAELNVAGDLYILNLYTEPQ